MGGWCAPGNPPRSLLAEVISLGPARLAHTRRAGPFSANAELASVRCWSEVCKRDQ